MGLRSGFVIGVEVGFQDQGLDLGRRQGRVSTPRVGSGFDTVAGVGILEGVEVEFWDRN